MEKVLGHQVVLVGTMPASHINSLSCRSRDATEVNTARIFFEMEKNSPFLCNLKKAK